MWTLIKNQTLENVAINDVLPLKAYRRDAIANLKCLWASDTRDLISMVTFTFTMRRHLIRLASAPFILFPPVWQRLVGFGFRVQGVGSIIQNLRRVGDNSDPIVSRLWTKVYEIFRRCRSPLYFPTPFSDCLCHVSFRRYSTSSLEVVEKQSEFFGPQFYRRDGSDFSTELC